MEANTELGQHFMIDGALLDRMVKESKLSGSERVLEIGPGPGALTKRLRAVCDDVFTVDIDPRFEADLHANILEVIGEHSFDTLVSNLPYHISEPLFMKLTSLLPEKIIVVVGEHFATHLQEDTILGTVVRDCYDVEVLESIMPSSFDPPPGVTSSLLRLTKVHSPGTLADFYQYPKSKVKNYLKTKTTKRGAQEFINKLPLAVQDKKLYTLSREEFLQVKAVVDEM